MPANLPLAARAVETIKAMVARLSSVFGGGGGQSEDPPLKNATYDKTVALVKKALLDLLGGETREIKELRSKSPLPKVANMFCVLGRFAVDFNKGALEGQALATRSQEATAAAEDAAKDLVKRGRKETKKKRRMWAKEALQNGAGKAHKFANALATRVAPSTSLPRTLQMVANDAAASWARMWCSHDLGLVREAFAQTRLYREEVLAKQEGVNHSFIQQGRLPLKIPASQFAASTARRPENLDFAVLKALAEGQARSEIEIIAADAVKQLCWPLQSLRVGGGAPP